MPFGELSTGLRVTCFWTLRLTWTRQRWIFVVGQVVVIALSAPFCPSVVTIKGGWS